jgi:argininosuccinate lyase
LGFRKTQRNELYAQNSRGKFESMILSALSQIMLDIQKLATDLILFSMKDFGFFRLPEKYCTGSSIMPQKKNPDVLEITRANFAVVHSAYLQIIEILKGLSSGYHRDLQLTKEPLIRGFNRTLETVEIMSLVLDHLEVDEDECRKACTDDIYAADNAYELVKKGAAFRDAYRKISRKLFL